LKRTGATATSGDATASATSDEQQQQQQQQQLVQASEQRTLTELKRIVAALRRDSSNRPYLARTLSLLGDFQLLLLQQSSVSTTSSATSAASSAWSDAVDALCGAPSAWTQWRPLLCTSATTKCTLAPAAALEVVFLLGKIVRYSATTVDTDKHMELCRMAAWLLGCSSSTSNSSSSSSVADNCEPGFPLLARALRNNSSSSEALSAVESALSDPTAPVSAGPLFKGLMALATSLLASATTTTTATTADAAAALPLLAAAEHLAAGTACSPRAVLTVRCLRVRALAVLGAAAEAVSVLASCTVAGGVALPKPLGAVEEHETESVATTATVTADKPPPARGYVATFSAMCFC
jgi:hypothetical protein